jgi:RND superfamily putative drug exporter
MSLAGRANWWLPAWLDRLLPHVDLEGEVHGVASAPEGEAAAEGRRLVAA